MGDRLVNCSQSPSDNGYLSVMAEEEGRVMAGEGD